MSIQTPYTYPKATRSKKRSKPKRLWFEKMMATITLINLGLVFFDLSYIPWRNFYLQRFPALTQWYGNQFKGIEPHRVTENYLEQVDALEVQVSKTGMESPEADILLAELRSLSDAMINENPFEVAGKSGTLERIKERMRERLDVESSTQAFETFWSQDYLLQAGWQDSINFFNQDIRPLIATNYYRNIGFDGTPLNQFWKIDRWFIGIFALEFLARTLYLSRRYRGTSWLDAIIWRWYDLFLLIPFWQWLRIIPATVRVNQSNLINLDPINNRIIRTVIAGVAVEITEMVVIRIIDQVQDAIRQGDVVRWLLNPETGRRYIDLNGVNEVEVIANRLTTVLVYQVLPKIRPDIETLLHHTVTSVLNSLPVYAGMQRLPGMQDWSNQFTQRLVSEVSQSGYQALTTALEDEVGANLVKELISHFGQALRSEIQQDETLEEIQLLLMTFLDEVKINYVKQVEAEDIETLKERKKELYGVTQGGHKGFITD